MDNTRRVCVTFGEVAWIQQIQHEDGLSDFQDDATIVLRSDENEMKCAESLASKKFFAFYLCASQSHMHVFFIICPINQKCRFWGKTLPKAQRTRGLSSYYRISIKHQLQNFNHSSASQLNLKLNSWPNLASEYWPRFNFVTSSKHQRQNADQTSASKSRLNFNFKIQSVQSLNKS